ncbi:hypothetical protein MTR67_037751 [Solanum verrucosum]|uniref:Uncharacterized protein n=1 Tax=Solanum verrucosum TaxID=315347 RepID=A0AAF0UF39_SOLVR|nr:hypothetical protein MTR67_037751 [Solanum verrucosum]
MNTSKSSISLYVRRSLVSDSRTSLYPLAGAALPLCQHFISFHDRKGEGIGDQSTITDDSSTGVDTESEGEVAFTEAENVNEGIRNFIIFL